MKGERIVSFGVSIVLAFVLSFGTAGCLVTGFGLELTHMPELALACAAASAVCSVCFLWKYGGWGVMGITVLLAGLPWLHDGVLTQILSLVCRILQIYAGLLGSPAGFLPKEYLIETPADYPLAIGGWFIALWVSRSVCRGRGTWIAAASILSSLAVCFVANYSVPDSVYLFAVMAGLALLFLTAGVRRNSIHQANILAIRITLPVVLTLSALFLAIPRQGYSYEPTEIQRRILPLVLDTAQTVKPTIKYIYRNIGTFLLNGTDSVYLQFMGSQLASSDPVMEVTADTDGILYLRGHDYDRYTGVGWTSSERTETFSGSGQKMGSVMIRTQSLKRDVYMPYYPMEAVSLESGAVRNQDLLEYTLPRVALPNDWQQRLSGSTDNTDRIPYRDRYVSLPDETKDYAQILLADILPPDLSRTEKADVIAAYVRSCARYDLEAPSMDTGESDFAVWFLEQGESGYCVHFASAATVLLRAANIPARFVMGYAAMTEAGKPVTITGKNTHAWVEYYEPELNTWLILEATPIDLALSAEPEADSVQAETKESIPFHPAESPLNRFTTPTISLRPGQVGFALVRFVALLLLAAVLLLPLYRQFRLYLRRKAFNTADSNALALARWQEAEQLAKLLEEAPPEELMALAQKAKFSQHTLSAEELAQFNTYRRDALSRLKQKPWYLVLVYRYVLVVF